MIRKALIAAVAVILVVGVSMAHAGEMGRVYKLKRLTSELYEKRTRNKAKNYLSNYGKEVTPFVLPLLKDKSNERVRVAALYIIGKVADTSAEPQVIVALKDHSHRVRQEAAKALSSMGSQKAVDPLKGLLGDYYPNVRFNALRALAFIAPKGEEDFFISVLNDYDPRIRLFAIKALGELKSKKAVPYLAQMVGDPDPAVRMELSVALGEIGSDDCLQPLTWLVGDPDTNVRITAVENLGNLKTRAADDSLVQAADSSDPRIASRAIRALTARKSPQALAVAKEHLDDEHLAVKIASIDAVGQLGGSKEEAILEPLLTAESTKVRRTAEAALQEVNDGK